MFIIATDRNRITKILDDSKDDIGTMLNTRELSSCSRSYNTIEELREQEGVPEMPCRECASIFSTKYLEPTRSNMISANVCFHCYFWLGYYIRRNDPKIARISGNHYMIEPENKGKYGFRGFGGHKFVIEFFDGRTITTTNLWHQGTIPEHFRERLPDNARFIEG